MLGRWRYILAVLGLTTTVVWLAVLVFPEDNLHLIACDVGQGDAILASYGDKQILIDGGPNNKVAECLDRHMPFWDRKIEVVILTHPQTDHFRGLIEVFKKFEVETFVATQVDSGTQEYDLLKSMVGGSGARVVGATSDSDLRLGLIQLDILHPTMQYVLSETAPNAEETKDPDTNKKTSEEVLGAYTTTRDLNDFSIVIHLSFGEFDALLTGDIGPNISDMIAENFIVSGIEEVEYIKIPHHGSKNGISPDLLRITSPEIAVISVGKNNSYGHPHEETMKILSDRDIKILRTDVDGDVEVITDGDKMWVLTN